jgi:hypothetical protein
LAALQPLVVLVALAAYITCAARRGMLGQTQVALHLHITLAAGKAVGLILLLPELIQVVVVAGVLQQLIPALAALVFVLSMNTIKVIK